MLIAPADLAPSVVAEQVRLAWGYDVLTSEYAPLGFGSHHWWITGPGGQRWFATVDDLRTGNRNRPTLDAALDSAAALRDSGLSFVVAPLRRSNGDLTLAIDAHHILAVYPHLNGQASTYGAYETHERRTAVLTRLVAIHGSSTSVRTRAPLDQLAIPQRANLVDALTQITTPWDGGPFAHHAQTLLRANAAQINAALSAYDHLAEAVRATVDRWVLTHGEPHRGNTIVTDAGVHLIDWETARLAPPERDLWALIDEDERSRSFYCQRTGLDLDENALDLYRRWWDLCEVSLYTADLQAEHGDTPETRIAWQGLRQHVDRIAATHDAVR